MTNTNLDLNDDIIDVRDLIARARLLVIAEEMRHQLRTKN